MHYLDRRRQQRRERDIMLALRDILARMSEAQDQDVHVPDDTVATEPDLPEHEYAAVECRRLDAPLVGLA